MLFAIGYRIQNTERERKTSVKSLKHSHNQMAKVFYPHQLSLIQEHHDLETTMPTHKGKGYVISFDIIGSSRLTHPQLKEFLESSIHDCFDILIENYDQNLLEANGYRIKEMGDGILCSINYPFSVPSGKSAADLSIEISEKFLSNLDRNVQAFQFPTPVFGGVGIAKGDLQGYYPRNGTKEYDIYGHGIILATRYEAMRKKLFPATNFHIMIIQNQVYDDLSEKTKSKFSIYQLAEDERVRDDGTACQLYYSKRFPGLATKKSA